MDILFNLQSENDFKTVAEDIVNHLYTAQRDSSGILDENTMITVKEEIKNLLFESNVNVKKINDILSEKNYEIERIGIFLYLIEKNQEKLMYLTLVNHNSAYGEALENFDWALKLVHGTSELKKLHYPLLQIVLTNIHKMEKKHRVYDVSKDMLGKLIDVLENIDTF
ncbi:unnamed protein product, partial [Brenthis ino]